SGLGWPTAPPLHGSALITLQPLLERLITHHPVRAPDRLLLWVLLDQKLTPTPLAAAVVYAPFQVVRVFRQQGVGGPCQATAKLPPQATQKLTPSWTLVKKGIWTTSTPIWLTCWTRRRTKRM